LIVIPVKFMVATIGGQVVIVVFLIATLGARMRIHAAPNEVDAAAFHFAATVAFGFFSQGFEGFEGLDDARPKAVGGAVGAIDGECAGVEEAAIFDQGLGVRLRLTLQAVRVAHGVTFTIVADLSV
jgi:hypothetical protein